MPSQSLDERRTATRLRASVAVVVPSLALALLGGCSSGASHPPSAAGNKLATKAGTPDSGVVSQNGDAGDDAGGDAGGDASQTRAATERATTQATTVRPSRWTPPS